MPSTNPLSTQRGSVVMVTLVSLVTVGSMAAGLTTLRNQGTESSGEAVESLQGMSVSDSVRIFTEDPDHGMDDQTAKDIESKLYRDASASRILIRLPGSTGGWYDGLMSASNGTYGYSMRIGSVPPVSSLSDLKRAAPGIEKVCESIDVDGADITATCTIKKRTTLPESWNIKTDGGKIDFRFNLSSQSLTFAEDLKLQGDEVNVAVNSPRGSFNVGGNLITQATDDDSTVSFNLGNGSGRSAIDVGGAWINEASDGATTRVTSSGSTGGNFDVSVGGPLVAYSDDGDANLTLNNVKNSKGQIDGEVFVSGDEARMNVDKTHNSEFVFADRVTVFGRDDDADLTIGTNFTSSKTKITFEDMTTVYGEEANVDIRENIRGLDFYGKLVVQGDDGDSGVSIRKVDQTRQTFHDTTIVSGEQASFKINEVAKSDPLFGDELFLYSDDGQSRFRIDSAKAKNIGFTEDVLVHGEGTSEFRFSTRNSDVKFDKDTLYSSSDLDIRVDGKGDAVIKGDKRQVSQQSIKDRMDALLPERRQYDFFDDAGGAKSGTPNIDRIERRVVGI